MTAYLHIVKMASGIVAVQVVRASRRGSRDIEHVGPSVDDAELETFKAVARQQLTVGQIELGPRWTAGAPLRPGYVVIVEQANKLILEGIPEYRSPGSS